MIPILTKAAVILIQDAHDHPTKGARTFMETVKLLQQSLTADEQEELIELNLFYILKNVTIKDIIDVATWEAGLKDV
jgi:hypothetical protein